MKKIVAKLVGSREQREDFSAERFRAEQKDKAKLARERQEQIMRGRSKKYVSERTTEEILGPSDSAVEEKK